MNSIPKNLSVVKKNTKGGSDLDSYIAVYSGITLMGFINALLAEFFNVTLSSGTYIMLSVITFIPFITASLRYMRFQDFLFGIFDMNFSGSIAMGIIGVNASAQDQVTISIVTLGIAASLWLYRSWTKSTEETTHEPYGWNE